MDGWSRIRSADVRTQCNRLFFSSFLFRWVPICYLCVVCLCFPLSLHLPDFVFFSSSLFSSCDMVLKGDRQDRRPVTTGLVW